MNIVMSTPEPGDLDRVVTALRGWQNDGGPLHLHPGDLGWYSLRGASATATAIRIWARGKRILAVGLLDGPQLLRMALDPEHSDDDGLALRILADLQDAKGGVLDPGEAAVEARGASGLSRALSGSGWQSDEPWTPLHRDLTGPVENSGLRVEPVGPDRADLWVSIHWSAFRDAPLAAEERRRFADGWRAMAAGPFYEDARSLIAFDRQGEAVAVAAVWSAGRERPGLVEPLGVHQNHRGQGHGAAMTLAAASALREMGSSCATVCAESSNTGAVATYVAAGFTPSPEVADFRRTA